MYRKIISFALIIVMTITAEACNAVNVNHQETAKAHDNDRLQARADEYGFLLGDNFHGQEDTSSIFSDELLLTLKNYFDIYENDDISELCADQKLIKAWKEEYQTFKSRANEAYMDTEYESRHKERIIEGCPYVDDHLCFIVISYEFYIHYIRIEKKNNSWFITDDIGNGNFISPYGYNTESQYLSDAGEAFLSAARKLLGEAYDQIVDSNTLTEKELNLSMEKAKTGMLRDVFGIPETAGENTGDSGGNGDNDYEILISDPKSTEQRIVDWMIVQRGCVPDRIPRVWACVCEKEGLLQKSSYQSDQIGQTSGMPGAYYCLVNPHGDLLSTYDGGTVNDGEYASFVDNGIDGWYGHVFEYGFEPYQ